MKKLIYFADPMCSWCYAFNIVLEKIRKNYPELRIDLVAGGYSPGNTDLITEEHKDFLRNTWQTVSAATGAKFNYNFEFADENFCYDTEPPSRALKVIQIYDKGIQFNFLELMQKTFYVENLDITKEYVLADLAGIVGLDWNLFLDAFNSDVIKQETVEDFNFSRKMEVGGFPTMLAQNDNQYFGISFGFQPFKLVKERINYWLKETKTS